jgi:hypothetical protein
VPLNVAVTTGRPPQKPTRWRLWSDHKDHITTADEMFGHAHNRVRHTVQIGRERFSDDRNSHDRRVRSAHAEIADIYIACRQTFVDMFPFQLPCALDDVQVRPATPGQLRIPRTPVEEW